MVHLIQFGWIVYYFYTKMLMLYKIQFQKLHSMKKNYLCRRLGQNCLTYVVHLRFLVRRRDRDRSQCKTNLSSSWSIWYIYSFKILTLINILWIISIVFFFFFFHISQRNAKGWELRRRIISWISSNIHTQLINFRQLPSILTCLIICL